MLGVCSVTCSTASPAPLPRFRLAHEIRGRLSGESTRIRDDGPRSAAAEFLFDRPASVHGEFTTENHDGRILWWNCSITPTRQFRSGRPVCTGKLSTEHGGSYLCKLAQKKKGQGTTPRRQTPTCCAHVRRFARSQSPSLRAKLRYVAYVKIRTASMRYSKRDESPLRSIPSTHLVFQVPCDTAATSI